MCELCSHHGEGKIRYLNAKNYSRDMANELTRKKFSGGFYQHPIVQGNRKLTFLEKTWLRQMNLPGFVRRSDPVAGNLW